jgi:hypothetical protein
MSAIGALRLVAFNPNVPKSDNSAFRRERLRAKRGIGLVVSNRPALLTYDAPRVVSPAASPIELEARNLAATIRREHERASATCGGDAANFIVPGWSDQEVLYAALAILNKEGMRLGSMSVADEGCWKMWFYKVEEPDYTAADFDYSGC